MTRAKLFRNNRSQAVRLPKALAFPDEVQEVEITRVGDSLVIVPAEGSLAQLLRQGPLIGDDVEIPLELAADVRDWPL